MIVQKAMKTTEQEEENKTQQDDVGEMEKDEEEEEEGEERGKGQRPVIDIKQNVHSIQDEKFTEVAVNDLTVQDEIREGHKNNGSLDNALDKEHGPRAQSPAKSHSRGKIGGVGPASGRGGLW
ncbi:unnamed protein product [Merluccius merluccius]